MFNCLLKSCGKPLPALPNPLEFIWVRYLEALTPEDILNRSWLEQSVNIKPEFAKWAAEDHTPYSNSVMFTYTDNTWNTTYSHWYTHSATPSPTNITKHLDKLRQVGYTYWDNTHGFHPRFGSLGLVSPLFQLVVGNEDQYKWYVFGQQTLYGNFVAIFDTATVDANGNPHPNHPPYKLDDRSYANLKRILSIS